MANLRNSSEKLEYATVDTQPDSNGYFTSAVSPRDKLDEDKVKRVFFSIRKASATPSVTVKLQFRCPGDTLWTDYVPMDGSSLALGNRVEIADMGLGVIWRAGVEQAGYISGSVSFGFDW